MLERCRAGEFRANRQLPLLSNSSTAMRAGSFLGTARAIMAEVQAQPAAARSCTDNLCPAKSRGAINHALDTSETGMCRKVT
jgi:hypothetical protein